MQKNNNRRRRLYEVAADVTEFPADALSSVPVFVIRGEHEVEADGCDGILEYESGRVLLSAGRKQILILGDGLMLSDFCGGALTVRGNIRLISLSGTADGGENAETDT